MQVCQVVYNDTTVYSPPCLHLVAFRGRPRLVARRSTTRRNATCLAQSRSTADLTAVVIGSGFAGLSAAAGLSKRFEHVTLLERDSIPFDVSPEDASETDTGRQRYEVEVMKRQGVSQYKQPHVLLARGLELMQELFPGHKDQLIKAGALETDLLRDIIIEDWGKQWPPGKSSGIKCLSASRHLYETVLRTCVAQVGNISVQTTSVVTGVEYDVGSKRITGVKLKNKQSITADLVVNATGRSSQMTEWLQQAGHNPPPTMTVDAGLRYTSRMYEIPDDPDRAWTTAVIGSRPGLTKQCSVTSIETNKWQVLLAGYPGHHCPSDDEGFMQFARSLPTQTVYNALQGAKPVTPVTTFAQTRNFRRMYERAPPPKGLCMVGDAVCCFNPAFGQGMTVGMMGSHLLCETIDKQLAKAGPTRQQQLAALEALPTIFHKKLGKMLDYPWAVVTGEDAKKPDAFVELPDQSKEAVPKWLNSYVEFLWKACFDDKYLIDKLARVNHMLAPPTALFTPDVSLRLLWVWIGIQASTLQKQLKSRSVAIERL